MTMLLCNPSAEVAPSHKKAWPPNQDDSSSSGPAATATPLYIAPPSNAYDAPPPPHHGTEAAEPATPTQEALCCLDPNKRMSICSEEICQLSEEKRKLLLSKGENMTSLTEEGDRPESPIPFGNTGSDSAATTPLQEEIKSFGLSSSNFNVEEKREGNTLTKTVTADATQSSSQAGKSSSQSVERSFEEGGVQRTRTVKTEESFSHSSTAFSAYKSTKSSRCITPEICEIMDKPRGSPSLLGPERDRPATPQQVVVFPPEIPTHYTLPRSRACTPQPHALQRILSEELGAKPIHPPIPLEEVAALESALVKEESKVKIEELYTKSEVDDIVKKELNKYKSEENTKHSSAALKEIKHVEMKTEQSSSLVSAFQQQQQQQQQQFQQQQQQQQKEFEQQQLQQQQIQQQQLQQQQIQQQQLQQQQIQQQQQQQQKEFQQQQLQQQQIQQQQLQQQQEQQMKQQQQQQEQQMKQQQQQQFQQQQLQQQQMFQQQQQQHLQQLQHQEQEQQKLFAKKPDRPYSPVQPPKTVARPKPQPVPLPSETTPYYPPPPPPQPSEEEQRAEMLQYRNMSCQSPMISALTIAPNRPYSPLPAPVFKPIAETSAPPPRESSMISALTVAPSRPYSPLPVPTFKPITLDDLPPPPTGEPMSMLAALTYAPDKPFTPFPEPVDVSRKSPPKFKKWQQQQPPLQQQQQQLPFQQQQQPPLQQQQKQQPPFQQQQQLQVSCPKPLSAVKPSIVTDRQQAAKSNKSESAFASVAKPKPLPLPEPHRPAPQSTTTVSAKSISSVSNELTTIFKGAQNIPKPSVDQTRISPSGLTKPALLPYYQQHIGEIPLAHRPMSPVPHTIKAPSIEPPKRIVSDQVKRSSSVAGGYMSTTTSSSSSAFKAATPGGYGYVPSSVYGQTFTANKDESVQRPKSSTGQESSESLLPYYQQNIGEIPLAHRPMSPVPHIIKAPSTQPAARASPTMVRPSPLAGKAPSSVSNLKQVFKPEAKPFQNVFAAPPEPAKQLAKTLPHFTQPKGLQEPPAPTGGVPWVVKKVESLSSSSASSQKTVGLKKEEKSLFSSSVKSLMTGASVLSSLPSQKQTQPSAPSDFKPAAGFTPTKPVGAPTTSVPPTGAGGQPGAPGNKGATFAGTTGPKRGRGTLNPSVAPGARIPLCGSCNRQIRGPFITALGKIWCPEHFICANAQCRRPLQDIGFVEESSGLYCEFCFEQFLAPACSKCSAKIKGDCLNAIGKHFHPECFSCAYCGKLFGNSPFFLEDALPYCENDWNELFTTKCFSCGFPIEAGDRWVEALSNNYHSQCFNCTMCKKNLEGQSFYAKGGRPFCKNHAR